MGISLSVRDLPHKPRRDLRHRAPSRAIIRLMRSTPLLFDLDGTLIDSIELILSSMRHAFDGYDGQRPDRRRMACADRTTARRLVPRVRRATKRRSKRLIGRYREYQLAHHDRLVRPYDGIVGGDAAPSRRRTPDGPRHQQGGLAREARARARRAGRRDPRHRGLRQLHAAQAASRAGRARPRPPARQRRAMPCSWATHHTTSRPAAPPVCIQSASRGERSRGTRWPAPAPTW